MSVTLATIRAKYPEFTSCPDATLQAHLDDALTLWSESSFGDLYDQAIIEYTCLSVSDSGYGKPMAIVNQGETRTNHHIKFERLLRMSGCAGAGIVWGS